MFLPELAFLNAAEATNNRDESCRNGEGAVSFTALSNRQEAFLPKFACLSIHGHSLLQMCQKVSFGHGLGLHPSPCKEGCFITLRGPEAAPNTHTHHAQLSPKVP